MTTTAILSSIMRVVVVEMEIEGEVVLCLAGLLTRDVEPGNLYSSILH